VSHPLGAVVIPDDGRDDLEDTVASVRTYLPGATTVVVDDRSEPAQRRALGPQCTVLPPLLKRTSFEPFRLGRINRRLWQKDCYGFRYVLANLDVDYVLRLDSDALVFGHGLDDIIVQRFHDDPECGLLGAYRLGRDGGLRDFAPVASGIRREAGWGGFRNPRSRSSLRALLREATSNGYVMGEHALGAVTAIRPAMLAIWHTRGWLSDGGLAGSALADDWLLGIATVAAGYSLGDLDGPGGSIAVDWKGLPASPETLVAEGALATHSVRSWGGRSERETRSYFAELRRNEALNTDKDPKTL
jgi:hypothetical protein